MTILKYRLLEFFTQLTVSCIIASLFIPSLVYALPPPLNEGQKKLRSLTLEERCIEMDKNENVTFQCTLFAPTQETAYYALTFGFAHIGTMSLHEKSHWRPLGVDFCKQHVGRNEEAYIVFYLFHENLLKIISCNRQTESPWVQWKDEKTEENETIEGN